LQGRGLGAAGNRQPIPESRDVPTHDIIVLGGSAGALSAVRTILQQLPPDLPAALFVAIHTAPEGPGILHELLHRLGTLPADRAEDGEPIRPGRIYVAPPDHHLLVKPGCVQVTRGPRENGFRPAVDPLFRTAAAAYGSRVLGVLLSGGQYDGVQGLVHVKRAGGVAIVQHPEEADVPSMPQSAIRQVTVDHVLHAADMAAVISGLVGRPGEVDDMRPPDRNRPDPAERGDDALRHGGLPGSPSPFTCPECGGSLWERRNGELVQYECHLGHGYGAETLVAVQSDGVEKALWTALRALEESAALRRRMAGQARERGMARIAASYDDDAQVTETRAALIRRVLVNDEAEEREPVSSRSNADR
jgi:two-component system chemotaxis response regulator CheB